MTQMVPLRPPALSRSSATDCKEWMDEHCQSGVSASETAETEDQNDSRWLMLHHIA